MEESEALALLKTPVEEMQERLGELRSRLAKAEAALKDLIDQIDRMSADPSYQAIWILHALHSGRYEGPNIIMQLEAARQYFQELPREPQP